MSYREYVPTCVETLFGRPPTKFKARAIIPESKTFNMDSGRCRCCPCEKYNSLKKGSHMEENFPDNDNQFKCIINCPDCRKQIKKKDDVVLYNERAIEKHGFKERRRNRKVDHSYYECYCTPKYDYTEEEYYPEGRTRKLKKNKHKGIKKINYCSEPSRSSDSPEHSDSERFCSVCQLWVKSDSKEKRDEYSSSMYQDRERVEDQQKTTKAPCSRGFHFVVESCKFCGNRRDGPSESSKKGEEHRKAMQSLVQSQEICELGRRVEQCSRSENFFKINQLDEPLITSHDKERDSCDEIYERFAQEIAAMERYHETPRDEDAKQPNSQENVLSLNKEPSPIRDFKKAHSTSEISKLEKQYINTNGTLEHYKQQLAAELKEKPQEKSPQNTNFRSCNCEYARRDWKAETQKKLEPDKSEIRILKKKCDEALRQLELFKREIAESKQGKCHCDLQSTMCVIEECKLRCAHLEKQVVYLQRCIDSYTRPKDGNNEGNWEIRQATRINENQKKLGKERKGNEVHRDRSNSRKRDEGREVVTANVKVYKKPKSTCPPPRERKLTCQHMKCFPPEQIPEIPSFKMCPGYQEAAKLYINKR